MKRSQKVIIGTVFLLIVLLSVFRACNKPAKLLKHKITKPEVIATKGRVAIVLDDWGYNIKDISLLFEIRSPVTIAVLPNLPYSKNVAQEACSKGYQVILHLPLESKSNKSPEKDTLYCNTSEKETSKRLKQILKSLPCISGVNNHQGSKATENIKMMTVILSELKNQGLPFLDSATTGQSVCFKVASSLGLKYAKRDVFLDLPSFNLKEERLRAYIRGQLYELAAIAVKNGSAIGIGHDRKTTLSVLKDFIPELEKKGIKFIFLSELEK